MVTIVRFQIYLKDISKKTIDEWCEEENQNPMAWFWVAPSTDVESDGGFGEKSSIDI